MELEAQQLNLFDYASLDTDTRLFVQEKAQAIHTRLKRTAEDIIAIGLDLLEVKTRLQYGQFKQWIAGEFDMSYSASLRFMQVAQRFGHKNTNLVFSPTSILYELASPSMPTEVVEMVETGQIEPTLSAIREAKRELQHQPVITPILTEHDAALSGYRGYDRWQEAHKWEAKRQEVEQNVTSAPVEELLVEKWQPPEQFEARAQYLERWTDPLPTPAPPEQSLYEVQREIKREEARERIAQLKEKGADLPAGKYSCLVVDPPWPMQKIERDVRPNQVEFDYPTMTEDELRAFPLPDAAGDDCHLYLWATQKYLPMALRLAEHWGFRYQCLLTWRKNIGFTPFSWMYSTEHVLFCTRGSLPLLRLGVRLDFEAKVREHSRKPDEFYDIVREVSPGPRLDVFSREKRDEFDQYGNEVAKYVSAG